MIIIVQIVLYFIVCVIKGQTTRRWTGLDPRPGRLGVLKALVAFH